MGEGTSGSAAMTAPTHLLHWRADGNDCELVLECVGHDQDKCDGATYWDDYGEGRLHLALYDPAFPVAVVFVPIEWNNDLEDLGCWTDDGPIIVRDPRVAS